METGDLIQSGTLDIGNGKQVGYSIRMYKGKIKDVLRSLELAEYLRELDISRNLKEQECEDFWDKPNELQSNLKNIRDYNYI